MIKNTKNSENLKILFEIKVTSGTSSIDVICTYFSHVIFNDMILARLLIKPNAYELMFWYLLSFVHMLFSCFSSLTDKLTIDSGYLKEPKVDDKMELISWNNSECVGSALINDLSCRVPNRGDPPYCSLTLIAFLVVSSIFSSSCLDNVNRLFSDVLRFESIFFTTCSAFLNCFSSEPHFSAKLCLDETSFCKLYILSSRTCLCDSDLCSCDLNPVCSFTINLLLLSYSLTHFSNEYCLFQ
jgi:hypothetical protein